MRKRQKKIISMSDLYNDKDTCVFICEEVQFFWLTNNKFPNFLHELV